ncbi:nuclear transport factor 2 family protein [Nocardia jinanensis]|uniref:SnoaL-like domain-containing protein n=1 Tax=Nocardia jinanensis TaxID=382504 RepID=A0A917VX05_9NOCA|nr:nuclear transport factor 2 family protein [Nocardia jinanensis]GGL39692.1 hypothetical protein GCM10011588_63130 [Nocardia jinanensis]
MTTVSVGDLPDPATIAAVHQLYGFQSGHIDNGRAADWAATFTPTGEFRSPSYPEPVTGAAALTEFARAFDEAARAADEVHRHVVTNIAIRRLDSSTLEVAAYLQIIATPRGAVPRLVRMTTIEDRLEHDDGRWSVARRRVSRDDAPQR